MARKQKLIHLHGSTPLTKEAAANAQMVAGELAVMNGTTETSELYVLTSNGDIATFVTGAKVASDIATAKSGAETTAKGYADAAQSAAQTYADGVKTNLQGQIDALSNKVGTTDVAAQIQAAVAAEAEIARAAEKANADAIDAIEADYLKSSDRTALEGQIAAKVDQTTYDTKVGELVAADAANTKAINDHTSNGDIHVTAQQKTDWQAATDAINAFMDAENVGTEVVDTLKEIQDYINTDGAAADKMTKDIAANTAAIDAIEADYLKAADKTALEGQIAAKVDQTTYDTKVGELVAADAANTTAIANEKKRAEEAEAALQDAIDAIAGEGGSLADTLQAAKDYTDDLLGDGFTADKTVADAIAAEAARADAAEKANADAIKAISDDYLKTSDKEALQGAINAVDTAYKAADAEFTSALDAAEARIKSLEDAGYVKTVSVQNSENNKITATEVDGVVTMNFDNMVIDCGTYDE